MDESSQDIPLAQHVDAGARAVPLQPLPSFGSEVRQLARLLYNHNPFYVVSALLVFSGLWQSFTREAALVEAGAIALGLAAYALLLALTAWLIIRLGRVWEDARSLLLLIVLMFLAISVSSDAVLNAEEQPGSTFVLAGFAFAVAVSEGVLRSLPLRLPALYRLPYYLVLGLFFLYPLAMSPVLHRPPSAPLYWALFGFSAAAGAAFLTLLPAVRRGAEYVRDNGSPWGWPLYPWSLFVMLGVCVCLRAYSLCVSFHAILGTESIFGPYFLAPFLIAINALLFEACCVSHSDRVRRAALVMPMAILGLCAVGHHTNAIYMDFLDRFIQSFHGTPLYMALFVVIALYGYAFMRRIAAAGDGVTLALATASFIAPLTLDVESMYLYSAWPLVAAGLLQLAAGMVRGQSLRAAMGALAVLAALGLDRNLDWFGPFRGAILAHLAVAAVLVVGAAFADPFAILLRRLGAVVLAGACVAIVSVDPNSMPPLPAIVVELYPLVPIGAAAVYGRVVGGPLYYAAAIAGVTVWVAAWGVTGYRHLQHQIAGLNRIAWGIAFFLLAAMLSLAKAGIWSRPWPRDRARG